MCLLLAILAIWTAGVSQGEYLPIDPVPKPKVDCTWDGLDCGIANAACLEYDPVRCEAGTAGDPDGDGCGCWILGG